MEITDVRISLHSGGKLRAFVEIIINGQFVVHGIKVIEGTHRRFVAMPTRENGDRQVDVCHPTDRETREWLEAIVLTAYEAELHKGNGHLSSKTRVRESEPH